MYNNRCPHLSVCQSCISVTFQSSIVLVSQYGKLEKQLYA